MALAKLEEALEDCAGGGRGGGGGISEGAVACVTFFVEIEFVKPVLEGGPEGREGFGKVGGGGINWRIKLGSCSCLEVEVSDNELPLKPVSLYGSNCKSSEVDDESREISRWWLVLFFVLSTGVISSQTILSPLLCESEPMLLHLLGGRPPELQDDATPLLLAILADGEEGGELLFWL